MTRTNARMMATAFTVLGCVGVDDHEPTGSSELRIGSEVSCPSCTIVFDSIVTLGGAYTNGPVTTMGRDSASGYYYIMDAGDGLLKVYGRDGGFVRQIGRNGGGPGEYEMVRNILFAGDGSLRMLDGVLGRLTVFSPAGEFLDSHRVPVHSAASMPAVILPDDHLVVNESPGTPGGSGNVLKVIDPDGNLTHQMDEAPSDPRQYWLHERLLWGRSNGEFLVARPRTFTVDVYTSNFNKKLTIARFADWIPLEDPEEMPSYGTYDKPFTPRLTTIWEDAQGLLWLRMVVPSPAWKPGPSRERVRRGDEETAAALRSRPRAETIIEVVDLERQSVLARFRSESSVGWGFGGGYFARSVEDSLGEPSLRISRVRLKR